MCAALQGHPKSLTNGEQDFQNVKLGRTSRPVPDSFSDFDRISHSEKMSWIERKDTPAGAERTTESPAAVRVL